MRRGRFVPLGGPARTFGPRRNVAEGFNLWAMSAPLTPTAAWTPRAPRFRRHPGLALTVAGVMFAGVLCLRMFYGSPADVYSMLHALPKPVVATTSGLRAGAVAGLLAVGLTVLRAVSQSVRINPTAWASQVLPHLQLGMLLGWAEAAITRQRNGARCC